MTLKRTLMRKICQLMQLTKFARKGPKKIKGSNSKILLSSVDMYSRPTLKRIPLHRSKCSFYRKRITKRQDLHWILLIVRSKILFQLLLQHLFCARRVVMKTLTVFLILLQALTCMNRPHRKCMNLQTESRGHLLIQIRMDK